MTAEELKAMSDGDLRELAEEIRHELRLRYNREWNAKNREQIREWRKENPQKAADYERRRNNNYFNKHPEKRAIRDAHWIEKTLADVERAEEIAKYENSL